MSALTEVPMSDNPLDPILRKSAILADLGVDNSTLSAWMRRGDFPLPLVLNPGQKREIVSRGTCNGRGRRVCRNARQTRSKPSIPRRHVPSGDGAGRRSAALNWPGNANRAGGDAPLSPDAVNGRRVTGWRGLMAGRPTRKKEAFTRADMQRHCRRQKAAAGGPKITA